MKKLFAVALSALYLLLWNSPIHAQSANPFNPDYAWCNTQGAIATRTAQVWGCLTPGTAGQVLRTNGPGANASWQTVTGSGTVTSVGLTMPSFLTVTGSPITTTGTLTGTLASQTANTFFVAPNGSAGVPTFRAMAAADMPGSGIVTGGVITGTFPALTIGAGQVTGAMIGTGAVGPTNYAAISIANSKLGQQADSTIKSNISGSLSAPSDNTITAVLDKQLGTTQGAIAYRDSGAWLGLAPSAGGILQSNGTGANPSWVIPSAAIPASVGTGHRLTLTSLTPIMTANVAAGTTIYSTPYLSDLLLLWNGTSYVPTHCAETSQLLSDTTKSPSAATAAQVYDLFAWNDSGTCRVTRGPAWSAGTGGSNVVRGTGVGSTAIARTNFGILSNINAITNGPAAGFGTYMGTVSTDAGGGTVTFTLSATSAGCTVPAVVNVWNMYNRVNVNPIVFLTQASHSYTASAMRFYNNSSSCIIVQTVGQVEDTISAFIQSRINVSTASVIAGVNIGIDSGTAAGNGISSYQAWNAASSLFQSTGQYFGYMGLGAHFLSATEQSDNVNVATFNDNGSFIFSANLRY